MPGCVPEADAVAHPRFHLRLEELVDLPRDPLLDVLLKRSLNQVSLPPRCPLASSSCAFLLHLEDGHARDLIHKLARQLVDDGLRDALL